MSVNDPIADMLTRIRNGVMSGHPVVAMPSSKLKAEIARILKEEGFVEDFEVEQGSKPSHKVIRIKLKYVGERRNRRSVITGVQRVSRPGCRVYTHKKEIPWVLSGMGNFYFVNSKRCDDWTECPEKWHWRGSLVQGLVKLEFMMEVLLCLE